MQARVFAGADPLDASVDRILACDDRYREPVAERILPDGAIHLILNLGDPPTGERNADLSCLAMGATLEPTQIVLAGHVDQVCVRLRVGAASAVLGVPARAITDRGVALDELWGRDAAELMDRLAAAPRARRTAIVERALAARIARATPASPMVRAAVRRIAASAGTVRVAELARDLGVSERRLQQLFLAEVGLTPKATCRLARFRALLERCRRAPTRSWIEVALDGGYYDQAHLVHEVKELTGLTPRQLADGDFGFFQDMLARAD